MQRCATSVPNNGGVTFKPSYGGQRSGPSRSVHAENRVVGAIAEVLQDIQYVYGTSEDACSILATQHGGNLVAHTSRAAELAAAGQAVDTWRIEHTTASRKLKHERGGPHRAPW